MKYKIISSSINNLPLEIELSSSKSISNRVLILRKLAKENFVIHKLSSAQDTQTLLKILNELDGSATNLKQFDVGPAGTTMRFLTALFAISPGEFILSGSERMNKRPISILVDALKNLGASIEYIKTPNFPPLKISGKKLSGAVIELDSGVSSQFISALLLISSSLEKGLQINFKSKPVSFSYIKMTLELMKEFGVSFQLSDHSVTVFPSTIKSKEFIVESDWSAASYWYSIVALSDSLIVNLKGLKKNSLQGDAIVAELFLKLGVESIFSEDGVRIQKIKNNTYPEKLIIDFENCPDIAQTLVVTCCALKIPFDFTGLQTLNLKESRRIDALITEVSKIGIQLKSNSDSHLCGISFPEMFKENILINTYDDHRMAMSFAALSLRINGLTIDDPEVVVKSYPEFWEHLKKAGFSLIEINQ